MHFPLDKISIVGADGYIGQNLVKQLSILNYDYYEFNRNSTIMTNGILNPNAANSDVIIWCASSVTPISANSNPDLIRTDLDDWVGFIKLLNSSRAKQIKIVFLSSAGCTYSESEAPFSEHDLSLGTNAYGKMKLQMESSLIASGINYLILRISNVYGPNQPTGRGQGVIAEWVRSLAENKPLVMFGDRDSYRDYIYIDDLTSAIVSLLENKVIDQKVNIGSGKLTTLGDLEQIFSEISGVEFTTILNESRNTDRRGYFLKIEKILNMTNWYPRVTIRNGIRLCLSYPNIELSNNYLR
jgi:UDP-glucose 4-epimerase